MGPINTSVPERASRTYRELLGWPVTTGHRYRPRSGCTCGEPGCSTPGAHPRREVAVLTGDEVALGGALIAATRYFDALVMPKETGLATLAALGEAVVVPCVVDETRAVLLVRAATGQHALENGLLPTVELRTGPTGWIALPPSHRTRWDTPPWHDRTGHPVLLPHGQEIRSHLLEALGHGRHAGAMSDVCGPVLGGFPEYCVYCERLVERTEETLLMLGFSASGARPSLYAHPECPKPRQLAPKRARRA
ncbi:hypothetical protein AB0G74_10855 [Streptomyces sp. NPDC020875]|uniref:hypothetical protein n=1 Tax=Streptomyces sp. NPDC020875 TaxID=3154898 RepID=UPI0033FA9E44